ncbi:MAG: glycosyltransferase [Candidatus Omnitrophota bacterium]|nr:glycosyltransferase [Candidatus Omnitrophota bacterium]
MKVNLYGNNANMAYVWGGYLKKLGVDVTAFVDKKPYDVYHTPEWEYPDHGRMPDWARVTDISFKRFFIPSANEKKFIRELSDCDLIQTFGEAAVWALRTDKPYVYWSYGYDLDVMPFLKGSIKNFVLSRLARKSLAKAARLIYAMPHQKELVERLGLSNAEFYSPLPIDVDRYAPFDEARRGKLRSQYDADYIFIHLSRHNWVGDMPDNKGNDRLFTAYRDFIKNTKKKPVLLTVEKGKDVQASKSLIKDLGIEKYVLWLPVINKEKVIELLNIADINFDQFCTGSWGLVMLEAMSVGVPTFIFIHERCKNFYDELPPAINVNTAGDILGKMMEFAESKDRWADIRERSRDWVRRHYHWEVVMKKYIEIYKGIVAEKGKRQCM